MNHSSRHALTLGAAGIVLAGLAATPALAQWTQPARTQRPRPTLSSDPPTVELGLGYGVFSPKGGDDVFGGSYWLNLKPGSRVGITAEVSGYGYQQMYFVNVGPRFNFAVDDSVRGYVQVLGGVVNATKSTDVLRLGETVRLERQESGLGLVVSGGVVGWSPWESTDAALFSFGLEGGWNRGWISGRTVSAFRALLRIGIGF